LTHSHRILVTCFSILAAAELPAQAAFAQTTASAAIEGTSEASSPSPEDDTASFCNDHWLAVERCRTFVGPYPRFVIGEDIGVSSMNESGPFSFNNGVGAVTKAGPAWGLRLGIEVTSWLAFEARYVGMYNSLKGSVSPAGSLAYFTTGGEAVVRFTAPLPYVHPYLFGGIGYYDNSLAGTSAAKAGSPMIATSQPGIPMGVGFDVPLTWHVSVGAEATYHFNLGESYSNLTTNKMDGGDISTFNAVLRLRL
jgi:hypothetical protein